MRQRSRPESAAQSPNATTTSGRTTTDTTNATANAAPGGSTDPALMTRTEKDLTDRLRRAVERGQRDRITAEKTKKQLEVLTAQMDTERRDMEQRLGALREALDLEVRSRPIYIYIV